MILFFITCLYIALYYIRPAEWVPGLVGTPLVFVVGVLSLILVGVGALAGKFPYLFTGNIERMMFGFILSIALSHLCRFYFGGTIDSLLAFLPTIIGFLLVTCVIDSRKRVSVFVFLLIALTTFLAYEGWWQHSTGFAHGGMEPYYEKIVSPELGIIKKPRIRWYGVFNDPNDLGLALVLVVPFLLEMLLQRNFIVPLLTLPIITLSIYYTNSRGTVLSGLVAIGSYFIIRYRSLYGALAGVLFAVVLFLIGPSRISSISTAEESAYGRIEAWYKAYQMFRANPLFGVGQRMFTEFHFRTAHNSFVLVMAELGFVGLFFFTGLFYFTYYWLYQKIFKLKSSLLIHQDIGLISAAYASLTGMLAAMFFLSRSYVLLPFMLIALVISLTRVIDSELQIADDVLSENPKHFRNITGLTILQIIGINIVVKLAI